MCVHIIRQQMSTVVFCCIIIYVTKNLKSVAWSETENFKIFLKVCHICFVCLNSLTIRWTRNISRKYSFFDRKEKMKDKSSNIEQQSPFGDRIPHRYTKNVIALLPMLQFLKNLAFVKNTAYIILHLAMLVNSN